MNTTEEEICGLKRENFQSTIDGKKTDLYILKNANNEDKRRVFGYDEQRVGIPYPPITLTAVNFEFLIQSAILTPL